MAVFLDLAKAFELANPKVILSALSQNGIGGHLLAWLCSFLSSRSGRVSFQGHVSSAHPQEHGIPQGSILSPLLFNIRVLMEGLANPRHGRGVRFLVYTNDLALISTGPNFDANATPALATLRGMKIMKTFSTRPTAASLRISDQVL